MRADILHDVGASINPALDLGQVEGAFIQGLGWLTTEELVFDAKGRLTTHAPSTYKIPVASDAPPDFRTRLHMRPNPIESVYRSKAVGEPPLMLAIAVYSAILDAVHAVEAERPAEARSALHAGSDPERDQVDRRVAPPLPFAATRNHPPPRSGGGEPRASAVEGVSDERDEEIVEIAPRLASPLLAVGSAARAPSTALTRGSPPPRRGEDGASPVGAAIRRRNDAADKSVTQAGDFKDLGAILRARRRSVGARSSLSSRRVKFRGAFVKRRQVLSSFVKALLDRVSGNFKGLRPPQVDKRGLCENALAARRRPLLERRSPRPTEIHDRPGSAIRKDIVALVMQGHGEDTMRIPDCRPMAPSESQPTAEAARRRQPRPGD